MRFSDRISFVTEPEKEYDPNTGRYTTHEPVIDTKPCKLSSMGSQRTVELFGEIDRVITVARLQRPYTKPFDYVLIDNQKYTERRQSDYRKGVFYLEGVAHGN